MHYIDVILPLPLKHTFTYQVSATEAAFLKPGMRVAVPFGKSKIYTGLVSAVHDTPPQGYEAKDIHQILDEVPLVTALQLQLWQWISAYYMCKVGEVMKAALPSSFLLESETVVRLQPDVDVDTVALDDDAFLVYQGLQLEPEMRVQDMSRIVPKQRALKVLNRLIQQGVVERVETVYEKYTPKTVRFVKLAEEYYEDAALQDLLQQLQRGKKQHAVIMQLFCMDYKQGVKVGALTAKAQVSAGVVKSLIDKRILEVFEQAEDRVTAVAAAADYSIELSAPQASAKTAINAAFKTKATVLLHGVTASGKTEVYIKLIEAYLEEHSGQVLYLLPEIALTTQIVKRLQLYFGEQILVFHSKYNLNERAEVWQHVLQGSPKARVIIGARSSVLLPFQDLGLIIVDEEHEQSFKQFDPAPRYHARDVALVLGRFSNAKVLLGSATPALETYYNCRQGKYGLVTLDQRYNNILPPVIELVDLKDKYKRKRMTGHFSDVLMEHMQAVLKAGKQVILFQNRRGYSPVLECKTCGHTPQCPHCDVSLTVHKYSNQLRCHYCSYHIAMQSRCLSCHGHDLDTKGLGTEQIEAELQQYFPDYKSGRMDLDTTRGKHGYDKIINAFQDQKIQILVGTQMLTKGLDFRNVALVGVLNADNLLNFPDFRAHERSFQLLLQVAGRSGRSAERGNVLIQSYNPLHNILQQVAAHDYEAMFIEQMQERHDFKYPPTFKLIKLLFKHKDFNLVNTAASWFAEALRQSYGPQVLGPEFPPVSRIRNQYHKHLILKVYPGQSLSAAKNRLHRLHNSFQSIGALRAVRVIFNVDPY